MVELDQSVAAVWRTMLSDDNEWLADKIISFHLTRESVRAEIGRVPEDTRALAFQTILRNRTLHGGILAPGSGVLRYGENGKGIKSRWYPETLATRIKNIRLVGNKISFIHGDGVKIVKQYAPDKTATFFVDPPYTAAGKRAGARLYVHNELDHEELFKQCERIKGDFLMTYDNAPELASMAHHHRFRTRTVRMKNTHHATMRELLIGKDLSWVP